MITLRLAIPAVLAAAAVAGCFTYFVTTPTRVDADQLLPPTVPNLQVLTRRLRQVSINVQVRMRKPPRPTCEAAEAILRRAPNVRASAGADEPPITGPIPLPKRRPVIRP